MVRLETSGFVWKLRRLTKISPVTTHPTGPQDVAKKAMYLGKALVIYKSSTGTTVTYKQTKAISTC